MCADKALAPQGAGLLSSAAEIAEAANAARHLLPDGAVGLLRRQLQLRADDAGLRTGFLAARASPNWIGVCRRDLELAISIACQLLPDRRGRDA